MSFSLYKHVLTVNSILEIKSWKKSYLLCHFKQATVNEAMRLMPEICFHPVFRILKEVL